jgi:uncharacterized membrane protein
MTKQVLSKSLAAFVLVLFASTVTKSFALTTPYAPTVHSLSAGQSGGIGGVGGAGGYPDPTGGGGGGNMTVHSSLYSE